MSDDKQKMRLTDVVKASVIDSGVLANLKSVMHDTVSLSSDSDKQGLKAQAKAAIDDIQQLIGATTDDGVSRKLSAVLAKLQNALQQGTVSSAMITSALAEISSAANSSGTKVLDAATDKRTIVATGGCG